MSNKDLMRMTKSDFEHLKKRYNEAVEKYQDSFYFKGKEVLTSYAKYLIQYLEDKFKK